MASEPYDIGDVAELTATFLNQAGAAANPTTVVCRVRKPDGTTVTLTTTNPTAGTFKANLVIDMAGDYWYQFVGTGVVTAAGENLLRARARQVV
jgi:hypothetical protein